MKNQSADSLHLQLLGFTVLSLCESTGERCEQQQENVDFHRKLLGEKLPSNNFRVRLLLQTR
ncbi:hypothetical protein EYF80_024171 [Liparis tanakae]|uniref:Uncharacterized protein n=1 Tax=Liparis tanakae TaxID=230148 RepID=A0A4Z2HLI1_9TELE|nr:hypothetical protein EYF80_024171 [Liparis tanakae]